MQSAHSPHLPFHSAKLSLRGVSLLIFLSRASTQSLAVLSSNAKQRTCFVRVPALGPSVGSGATTDRDAVGAYDADVADGVDDVRSWTSLLELILADVCVGAAFEITGRGGAFGAGPTVHAWRTCNLTGCQSICCDSFFVLILTDFGIGASRKVTRSCSANRAGATVETGRA